MSGYLVTGQPRSYITRLIILGIAHATINWKNVFFADFPDWMKISHVILSECIIGLWRQCHKDKFILYVSEYTLKQLLGYGKTPKVGVKKIMNVFGSVQIAVGSARDILAASWLMSAFGSVMSAFGSIREILAASWVLLAASKHHQNPDCKLHSMYAFTYRIFRQRNLVI